MKAEDIARVLRPAGHIAHIDGGSGKAHGLANIRFEA